MTIKTRTCEGCNIKKNHRYYGKIFLTEDGFCSVCNHKYKNRNRKKGFFEFTVIKKGKYDHLTHLGNKKNKNYEMKQHFYNTAKSGGIIAAGHEYQKYLEKKRNEQKSILDF